MTRRPLTLAAALAVAVVPAIGAADPVGLSFERLNRSYNDLGQEIAPIYQGPMRLQLASPRNNLVLRSHRLILRPAGDGTHHAELEVEVLGNADLVGQLDVQGVGSEVSDHVVVPPQVVRVPGRVRLVPTFEGLEVTPLELPATVPLRIESRLGRQLVGMCQGFALWLGAIDCEGLDRSMSALRVPVPAPGETYLLPAEEITAAERTALLRYLEDSASLGRRTAER